MMSLTSKNILKKGNFGGALTLTVELIPIYTIMP